MVCRIVGHEPEVVFTCLDLPEIQASNRAICYWQFVDLSVAIVRDRERFLRHTKRSIAGPEHLVKLGVVSGLVCVVLCPVRI